jgi:hypothetical protein
MEKIRNPASDGTLGGAGNLDLADRRSRPDYSETRRPNLATSVIGRKFGHWTAVWTDPLGKRIHCQCCCGRVRVLGLDTLEAGAISSCGCRPPTLQEREAFRDERARRKAAAR